MTAAAALPFDLVDPRPLVLVVEAAVLVRATMGAMLEAGGFRVISAASADEAMQVLEAMREITAVVTDARLQGSTINGFELARRIAAEHGISVIVASGQVFPESANLGRGVYFVAKPVRQATLVRLVSDANAAASQLIPFPPSITVHEPTELKLGLTARERDVLGLLVMGMSNREIADALGLAENTIKVHLVKIFRKLGVSSRLEAVVAGSEIVKSP